MTLSIGAKLPHTGGTAPTLIPEAARQLESAGFDSIWVSDHVALPAKIESYYPFSPDGHANWPTNTPYFDAITALTAAAAVTSKVRLGTAVLVVPQRNPVLTAKQLACVAALAGGRLSLGVGAGWLREEFELLGASFIGRGAAMEDYIALFREAWTGRLGPRTGGYLIHQEFLVLPTPPVPIPVLIGGHSPRALERAGRIGDGWLGQQDLPDLDLDSLSREIATVRAAAHQAGKDPAAISVVLRLVQSIGRHNELAAHLTDLARIGVTEIIIDVELDRAGQAYRTLAEVGA